MQLIRPTFGFKLIYLEFAEYIRSGLPNFAAILANADGCTPDTFLDPVNVSNDMIRKGLSLHGCWHYNLGRTHAIMDTVRQTADKLDKLITHRFPIAQIEDAFKLQRTGDCGKVLLCPWE